MGNRRQGVGNDIAYDMLLSDFQRDPAEEVRRIGRAIGICETAVQNVALVQFLLMMGETLYKHIDIDKWLTLMHDVHSDSKRHDSGCDKLAEWALSDPECAEWVKANASASANAEVR